MVPARVVLMPPTTATETTTASSGIIPPRFLVLVRELRFGGSANFKISTLIVLCAVRSGAAHGGQRLNPITHPEGESRATPQPE